MSQVDKTAERKEKLIEATVQIISEHGLENLRTAEICKIAGVNIAYLYDFFENKDDLIAQAFAASDERFLKTILDISRCCITKALITKCAVGCCLCAVGNT